MNSQQAKQHLQPLLGALQELSALPWSNITNWSNNARPAIEQLIPEHLELFNRMVAEPIPNVLEVFPGGTLQERNQFILDAIARAKMQPEYIAGCETQKQIILLFAQASLSS